VWVVETAVSPPGITWSSCERGAGAMSSAFRRSPLARVERRILEARWKEVKPGVKVKRRPRPDDPEPLVLVPSQDPG